jgi:hypothetical protein
MTLTADSDPINLGPQDGRYWRITNNLLAGWNNLFILAFVNHRFLGQQLIAQPYIGPSFGITVME